MSQPEEGEKGTNQNHPESDRSDTDKKECISKAPKTYKASPSTPCSDSSDPSKEDVTSGKPETLDPSEPLHIPVPDLKASPHQLSHQQYREGWKRSQKQDKHRKSVYDSQISKRTSSSSSGNTTLRSRHCDSHPKHESKNSDDKKARNSGVVEGRNLQKPDQVLADAAATNPDLGLKHTANSKHHMDAYDKATPLAKQNDEGQGAKTEKDESMLVKKHDELEQVTKAPQDNYSNPTLRQQQLSSSMIDVKYKSVTEDSRKRKVGESSKTWNKEKRYYHKYNKPRKFQGLQSPNQPDAKKSEVEWNAQLSATDDVNISPGAQKTAGFQHNTPASESEEQKTSNSDHRENFRRPQNVASTSSTQSDKCSKEKLSKQQKLGSKNHRHRSHQNPSCKMKGESENLVLKSRCQLECTHGTDVNLAEDPQKQIVSGQKMPCGISGGKYIQRRNMYEQSSKGGGNRDFRKGPLDSRDRREPKQNPRSKQQKSLIAKSDKAKDTKSQDFQRTRDDIEIKDSKNLTSKQISAEQALFYDTKQKPSGRNSRAVCGQAQAEEKVVTVKVVLKVRKTSNYFDKLDKLLVQQKKKHERAVVKILQISNDCREDDKMCYCTTIVSSKTLQLAERFIETLCKTISQSLKTEVTHEISCKTESPTQSRTSCHERGPTSEDQTRSACANEKKNERENSVCKKSLEKKSLPIPTKLVVSLGKEFSNTTDIMMFLRRLVGDKGLTIHVLPDTVTNSAGKTQCQLMASSKSAANKVRRILTSSKKEKIVVHCRILTDAAASSSDETFKSRKMKAKIRTTVSEMKSMMSKVLKKHDMKAKKLKADNQGTGSPKPRESDRDNIAITGDITQSDKLGEMNKQRSTFLTRCDSLIMKTTNLDSKATSVSELTDLLRDVETECNRLTAALPAYASREEIVRRVTSNQVSVILGETGSGKSTQIVQYLYDAGISGNGTIVCAQPRKLAAITLAKRVAYEMGGKCGRLIGYKTGVEKLSSDKTRILFCTDFCLLCECLKDPQFSKYSCIIIDEAHERCVYTDILLGMIKACLPKRPDLKVVITSATIDPQIFVKYFNSLPELKIPGRTYPVAVIYDNTCNSQDFEEYETRAVSKAIDIHKNEEPGDILVFLTSSVEIMRCIAEFEKKMNGKADFKCFALHGHLTPEMQMKVFERLPKGVRKIVFATNCAETSITMEGIKYVVDTGVAKEVRYDPKKNIRFMGTSVISKSSADQRMGRAGRMMSGTCYRLYSGEGYKSMAVITEPEILRVPLGQAMLKIAEMGIDVKSYDFVESPSADSIDATLNTLKELGALSPDGVITEMGRWISKLPLDPRQGFLVYEGYKQNLLYDVIVLASLISAGSNLFYRGLTESEEQKAARSRNQFASPYGDIFSWLNVYKTWVQLPKDKQTKWCGEHGINYKVMTIVHKCIREVTVTLSKRLMIKFDSIFVADSASQQSLRKLIFDANISSVCHFYGHSRAGYYAVIADKQVHIHPSSTLKAQNVQPEWVVYNELTKTTRDFIKGVTVIEEEWVIEAIARKKLHVDITEIRERRTGVVHQEEAGRLVFKTLVGPRYSNLRQLEEKLTFAGMTTVVVEADRDLGTLDIYSSSPMNQETTDIINMAKKETFERLESGETEIEIMKTNKRDEHGFRAVLGQGGAVKALLEPGQTNKILITKSSIRTSEEEILAKFSKYGDIKEYVPYHMFDPRGMICYGSFSEAQSAVENTWQDQEDIAEFKPIRRMRRESAKFEVRLSWCRRPVTGIGIAFINCPAADRHSLIGSFITLGPNKRTCVIQRSKFEDDTTLICFNTGEVDEMDIKDQIMALLGHGNTREETIRVNLCRRRIPLPSQRDIENMKEELAYYFADVLPEDAFDLNIIYPREEARNQVAFIRFNNPCTGFSACKRLEGRLEVQGQIVKICPKLKTSIRVPKSIMDVCESRFDNIEQEISDKNVTMMRKTLRQGDVLVNIESDQAEDIAGARELLMTFLNGDIIECENDFAKDLLTPKGKQKLFKIQNSTGALIIANDRQGKIHLHGSPEKVDQAKVEITRLTCGEQMDICLRGTGKAPGLLKALLVEYGNLQDTLMDKFQLTGVIVDFKRQKLSLRGSRENVEKASTSISELERTLKRPSVSQRDRWLPTCVACLSPVGSISDLYRLERCGHSYCMDCLKMQITFSVDNTHIPVTCAEEGCSKPMVWKDFQFFIQKEWITKESLVSVSMNTFVAANQDRYRFCPTADCPMVYEVTQNEEGNEFNCPACSVSICTSCHTPFHAGLPCRVNAKWTATAEGLEKWRKENTENRKCCPKCRVTIEKIEGCQKMICSICKTIFCWHCLKIFDSTGSCYDHLVKSHGGILPRMM